MNLEQRKRIYQVIIKTEALLEYAIRNADKGEVERLRQELSALVGMSE